MAVRRRAAAAHAHKAQKRAARHPRPSPKSAGPIAWVRANRMAIAELAIVLGLGLAVFSILSLLLAQSPGVPLVEGWRRVQEGLFGVVTVLLPVALVVLCILGLLRLRFSGPPVAWRRWAGGALLFACALVLADVWRGAGGSAGRALRGAFLPLVGGAGSALVYTVAAAVGACLLLEIGPGQAGRGALMAGAAAGRSLRWVVRLARPAASSLRARTRRARPERPAPQVRAPSASPKPLAQAAPATRAPVAPGSWRLPELAWLQPGETLDVDLAGIQRRCEIIRKTLASFNVAATVEMDDVRTGPTITQFGIRPAPGMKVSRITGLRDDLALALEAPSIRMEAPVPGRPYVGVEVPNTSSQNVSMRELLACDAFQKNKGKLRITLGRDVAGQPVIADLARMPHLLIAGATGSGKSVCLNSIIASLLYELTPDELQLIMVDPKRVELTGYNGIPHLRVPVVVEMEKVVGALQWTIDEMERRYDLFAGGGHRNLERYNQSIRDKQAPTLDASPDLTIDQYNQTAARQRQEALPYIVVIIDELADLMMTAPQQVEQMLCRLAQKARATGIHLVVATQRPSVDVITGLIKANFPTRIAFAVSSLVDSRTILDQPGAEKLLGRGDMLYTPADALRPIRVQGTYVHDSELEHVVAFWKEQRARREDWRSEADEQSLLASFQQEEESQEQREERLVEEAVQVIQNYERVSASLLQRRLRVSYSKASLLMDELEERGYVGRPEGPSRSREVLVPKEAQIGEGAGE